MKVCWTRLLICSPCRSRVCSSYLGPENDPLSTRFQRPIICTEIGTVTVVNEEWHLIDKTKDTTEKKIASDFSSEVSNVIVMKWIRHGTARQDTVLRSCRLTASQLFYLQPPFGIQTENITQQVLIPHHMCNIHWEFKNKSRHFLYRFRIKNCLN
jgi:hypothetical protein